MKKVNCILLVDDNPSDNHFHEITIKEADACNHIQVVHDGQSALEYIIQSGELNHSESFPKPDIIYLDINMPGMNGFEFLEEYQKLDEKLKSKIVIVLLSTSLNPDDEIKAMTFTDVKEFQNKPLTVETLHETVEKYF